MVAPNIVNVTQVTAKTASAALNTATSPTSLISNGIVSNTVIKVNNVIAVNTNTNSADVTVAIFRNSVTLPIAYGVTVPEKSTMVLLGKDTALYLEEGDVLLAWASSAGYLYATSAYEIISSS
jgi:hypothetical protein